jgi:LacI family transcriptional regulator
LKMNEISSEEIAKLAEVSRSTVSRVINNYPNVPEKTRMKVMKIIEEHNYYPNISAQVLAGKKTRILGLFLISDRQISGDVLANYIISSVIETASDSDYQVLINLIRKGGSYKKGIRKVKELFYQKRIDGGIFIGASNHEPFIEELIAEGFVIGIVDHKLAGRQEPNRIVMNFNNEKLGELVVDYLHSLNHRRIGIIQGDMKRYSGPAKYNGFLSGMKKYDLELKKEWTLSGDFSEQGGYMAIQTLLSTGGELPTALFAANDSTALGAIRALQEKELNVPGDISIIGIDNHILSSFVQPGITTFGIDFHEMMQRLTEALINMIEKGNDQFIQMEMGFQLIERQSCRAR